MKKLLTLFTLLTLCFCASAADLQKAEKLFQDGDFATALPQYQQLASSATGNTRLQAQLRAAACQFHMGEYLNAYKAMHSYPLPTDKLWAARFLLYRIHMARQTSNMYGRILQEREIDTQEAQQDPERWTRKQWQAQMTKDYEALWQMKEKLVTFPTESEALILNIKETDLERIPTLFDFTVQGWLGDLEDTPIIPLATARTYLGGYAYAHETAKDKAEKRAQLLQTAYELDGKNRQNARIFWQTDYILLPFQHTHLFTFGDKEKATRQALKELKELSGFTSNKTVLNKLKNLASSSSIAYGRSYAAYQAAQLAYNQDLRQEALEVCQFAATLPRTHYTDQCKSLADRITAPSFDFLERPGALVPQNPRLQMNARNISRLYGRVYPMTEQQLKNLPAPNYYSKQPVRYLTQLTTDGVKEILRARKDFTPLSQNITYKKQYFDEKMMLSLPPLQNGFYVLLVSDNNSFNPQESTIKGLILNSTDLALFATTGIEDNPDKYFRTLTSVMRTFTVPVMRFYTVNLKTGQVAPNAQVELINSQDQGRQTLSTGQDGMATFLQPVQTENTGWTSLYALAKKGNSTALLPSEISFHFRSPDPVELFVQTDRAIYRPGQKLDFSVQLFQRVVRGTEVLPNTPVKIEIRNANYDTIFTQTFTTNALGTAQGQFTLPKDARLGQFHINASVKTSKGTQSTEYSFSVEEYKRPDYEISLDKLDKALAYNKTATVTGKAQYYSGAPLGNAQVNYTITREQYVPPFYWWWRFPVGEQEEIARGQLRTDKQGAFRISFTPQIKSKDEQFARYRVHAEVLDESGRAIETSSSYKVSMQPYLFKATFAQGFYNAQEPLTNFAKLDLTNADGQSISGKISVEVHRLKPVKEDPARQEENKVVSSYGIYSVADFPSQTPSWEEWYQNASVDATVFTKELAFTTPGEKTLSLPALAEGVYRLTLKNREATTQNLLFIVAKDGQTLSLPALTLAQHDTYYPGETVRILLGATQLQNTTFLELYTQGDFVLAKKRLSGGVRIFEYAAKNTDRGGIALRWFGASNYRFYKGDGMVEVPFDNKKLTVSVDAPQMLTPGQKVTWHVSAKDSSGAPVNGQASLTVYDQSLDYYAKKENPFTFNNLFSQFALNTSWQDSKMRSSAISYSTHRTDQQWMQLLPLPSINLSMPMRLYKGIGMKTQALNTSLAAMRADRAVAFDEALPESADMKVSSYGAVSNAVAGGAMEEKEVTPRTNFEETAYFNTLLPVTNGKGTAQFTLPDSLTTWNVLGYALTKQGAFGAFSATSVARKDFMVKLSLPRFYREGDKGVLQAAVTNLTGKKITVPVTLTVRRNNAVALKDFNIAVPTKQVTVPPQETVFASWDITAPYAPDVYQVTATAKSFESSDGEQKDFLILPGTTRLLATANKALKNGANTLTLTELENNSSARAEVASLNLHPTLALSVLNSMPNLLLTPYKDLVSSLNRYVPLAVMQQFYTTYPQLKEAVKKLPKRTGLSAPWNENDPLRLTLLEQTPWTYQARGRQQKQNDIINLFDDKTVNTYLQKEMTQIKKFQNASGAFTWFEGGPDDLYLTLYALESFAQALHYKAAVPTQVAKRAFNYAAPKVEEILKKDKEGKEYASSFALYSAYVFSSFPKEWPEYNRAQVYIKKWADYADRNSRFMTPLGQIYAAAVYHRLGDDVKANVYLDKVLARMKYNELTGAYFAPEAQSWVWYNDTLTTQTVTLRTLLEIRPDSDKVDAMVQWLLFNRQTNQWHHSKEASQTVLTLMDVMQTKGALSTPSTYTVKWGSTFKELKFEPLDWTQDLEFVKQGAQITPADFSATVTKQSKMTDFASLSVVYRSATASASPKGVINVERNYFVRFTENGTQKLRPVSDLGEVAVGDEVEVQLTLTTDSAFEYVLLEDPKPAGFENADLISQWTWNPVSMYREIRDGQTRFFINRVPAGKMTLRYVLRPTLAGDVHVLPAQAQSMFAPEYGAHTASRRIKITR